MTDFQLRKVNSLKLELITLLKRKMKT